MRDAHPIPSTREKKQYLVGRRREGMFRGQIERLQVQRANTSASAVSWRWSAARRLAGAGRDRTATGGGGEESSWKKKERKKRRGARPCSGMRREFIYPLCFHCFGLKFRPAFFEPKISHRIVSARHQIFDAAFKSFHPQNFVWRPV